MDKKKKKCIVLHAIINCSFEEFEDAIMKTGKIEQIGELKDANE